MSPESEWEAKNGDEEEEKAWLPCGDEEEEKACLPGGDGEEEKACFDMASGERVSEGKMKGEEDAWRDDSVVCCCGVRVRGLGGIPSMPSESLPECVGGSPEKR